MTEVAVPDGLAAAIRRGLDGIGDPCSVATGTPMGLESMGLIKAVDVDADGNVIVDLRLTSPCCLNVGYFDVEIRKVVEAFDGVRSVTVRRDIGLDWRPDMMSEDAKRRRRAKLAARGIPSTV
jgi:metal-sulfur cluster biosynthetic enzyme